MVAEVPAAISGLKSLFDMVRAKLSADEQRRIELALSDVTSKLIEAQNESLARGETIDAINIRKKELEEIIENIDSFKRQTKGWVPKQCAQGITVYVDDTPQKPFREVPKYCPNCFANMKVSFLQEEKIPQGRRLRLVCGHCGPMPSFRHYNELPAHSEPENG